MTNSTKLKIEKGVPLPPKNRKSGITNILRHMDIGDSFVGEKGRNYRATASYLGIKITERTISERKVRVWRTG